MADIFRKKNMFSFFSHHFVIFAYIKNRMKCAIAINIVNLKPFDFFVSDDPSPRFQISSTAPTYCLRTYVRLPFPCIKSD